MEKLKFWNKKTKKKIVKCMAMILTESLFFGATVFASPNFTRSEEEWSRLRDNTLEYAEIQGLIEEYNATVLKNNIELNDFKKKYGKTNSTASERYQQTADEIMANLVEPDADSLTYAQSLSAMASALATVDNLRKSADSTLEDYDINYYMFEQAKMSLVQTAQTNRINLEMAKLSEENAKLGEHKANLDVENANTKHRVKVATDVEVLNAKEGLLKAQKDTMEALAQTENIRQKLMIMCGWAHDAKPEFSELPNINFDEKISSFSVAEDTKRAIENNYVYKANTKRLNNAKTQSQKDSLSNTLNGNQSAIANAVLTAYQNVKASQEAYAFARNNYEMQIANFSNVSKKHSLGMVSTYDWNSASIAKSMADNSVKQSELSLRISINQYEWTIAGLAKTE